MSNDDIHAARPLSLGEMIDLQAALERDSEEEEPHLLKRDAVIGHNINAAHMDDVRAIRAWLAQQEIAESKRIGSRLDRWGQTLSWLIRTGALLAGALTVAGWLEVRGGQPINVINFWTALIGTQLLFLLFVVYSIARWRGALKHARSDYARSSLPLMAAVVDKLWTRVVKPGQGNEVPAPSWIKIRRMYGEMMGWLALRGSQLLAVFYNLGAIAALLLWATISDPAFGWRSTLLNERTVYLWAHRIAAPWSWTGWGLPTADAVAATRYSSLQARFVEADVVGANPHLWATWWPFLLMSFTVFGLVPRLATYAWTSWRLNAAIAAAPWRSAAADQLLHRMRRPTVSSVSERAHEAVPVVRKHPPQAAQRHDSDRKAPVVVMKWSGVPVANDVELNNIIEFTLGQPLQGYVETIGGQDVDADDRAITKAVTIEGAPTVAVLVQGWHPPVGDYIDVIEQLRRGLKSHRRIDILVCGLGPAGNLGAPTEAQLRLWRKRLDAMGDPWLTVYPVQVGGLL